MEQKLNKKTLSRLKDYIMQFGIFNNLILTMLNIITVTDMMIIGIEITNISKGNSQFTSQDHYQLFNYNKL